jgi:hypothetical protein
MTAGELGMIATPRQRLAVPDGVTWAADTGCYGDGFPGVSAWLAWLAKFTPEQIRRCLFATAPDVVGNAAATLVSALDWLPEIRALGYPAGYVLQDGHEDYAIPWDLLDYLFVGGSTDFKLGAYAAARAGEARARGIPVHMGRVNSLRRLRYAEAIGCSTVDGTLLIFGPDVNLRRLRRMRRELLEQRPLWEV